MHKTLLLLALLATCAAAPVAAAHAFLDHAVPAVGSTVAAAPRQLRLFFTERIEPHFSGVTLTGPDGKPVAAGPAMPAAKNPAELVLPVPSLAPGRYRVRWHVVSVDTHRTEGDFAFTVGK